MASISSSVDIFSLTSTCKPFSARRSKPACASFSVTRTFFVMRYNHPSCCVRICLHTTQRASTQRIRASNIRRKADSRERMRGNRLRRRTCEGCPGQPTAACARRFEIAAANERERRPPLYRLRPQHGGRQRRGRALCPAPWGKPIHGVAGTLVRLHGQNRNVRVIRPRRT